MNLELSLLALLSYVGDDGVSASDLLTGAIVTQGDEDRVTSTLHALANRSLIILVNSANEGVLHTALRVDQPAVAAAAERTLADFGAKIGQVDYTGCASDIVVVGTDETFNATWEAYDPEDESKFDEILRGFNTWRQSIDRSRPYCLLSTYLIGVLLGGGPSASNSAPFHFIRSSIERGSLRVAVGNKEMDANAALELLTICADTFLPDSPTFRRIALVSFPGDASNHDSLGVKI
jgi:hypothetical protein